MGRLVSSRSTIKLVLVIALSLALSCVTAPGIRTADVAELHYGDREDAVVKKLGEGSEILYFVLDGKQYRYRLYTTIYTKNVYALLFMGGGLIAVHDQKQDFSECLNIDASPSFEQCVSNNLSEMHYHEISLGSYDFSHGVQAEQREQAERDKWRAGTVAVAVPLTVALPGIVPMFCLLSCGEGCKDPGARPYDYQDSCIDKMAGTLSQAINILHGNISYESIDKALLQIQHHKSIVYHEQIDEKTIDEYSIIHYSWSCVDSYVGLSIKLGLADGLLKWAWFELETQRRLSKLGDHAHFEGCEGTWSDINKCAKNKSFTTWKLNKEIGTYCPNADLGHADAQTRIGNLFYHGAYDLEQNLVQAFVWYSLAANNGNTYASVQLEKVVNQLSPEQLVEALHRLDEWQPGRCDSDLREAISEEDE